jgi:hypothetical protein
MGSARDHLSEPRPQPRGIARDVSRLRTEGAATAAELREFLGQMRGRSPQEMIGLVAGSSLTRSILLATFLTVLLLAALTIGPYFLKDKDKNKNARAPAPVAETRSAEPKPRTEPAPPQATGEGAQSVANTEATGLDPERAIDVMGIGETRVADPKKNPLEDKVDKLLDGIE